MRCVHPDGLGFAGLRLVGSINTKFPFTVFCIAAMCNIKPLIACSLLVSLALHPCSALPRLVLLFICLLGPKTWPEENQSYVRFGNRCSAGGCGFFSFFFFFFVLSSELRSTPQKLLIILIEALNTTKIEKNSGLYVISRVGIFREGPALAAVATSVSRRHHRLTSRRVSRSARPPGEEPGAAFQKAGGAVGERSLAGAPVSSVFFEVSGALPTSVSPPSPRKTPSAGDGCRKGSSGPGADDGLGVEDCDVHAWGFFRKSMDNALSF